MHGPPWAYFSRERLLAHTSDLIEIASGQQTAKAEFRYTLRRTRKRIGAPPAISWADSATCPAVREVVAGMRSLAVPHPAPYGLPDTASEVVLDGSIYELSVPSSDVMGAMTLSSNEGSPLATWVDQSLDRLDRCWMSVPPS